MGGQILERVEALARLPHVETTIEIRHRLAQREVAPRPRVRPGEVAREEPVGRPLADARAARRAAPSPRRREAPRARARSRSERASPTMYSALRREKPSAKSSSSVAAASRSRVGNAHASPTCVPKRSISRLRIATAAEERHLLRGDRADEHLERIGRERRTEALEPRRRRARAPRRRPPTRRTARARRRARARVRTTGSVSASSGSTSTPPGAASIRTSRPPTARCSPPSCQTFARSTPNARKRSVVSAKSNGPGTARNAMPGPYRVRLSRSSRRA